MQERFEAALDDDPTDWVTRLIYADWLDDQGLPLAVVQRYLAKTHKYPGPACVLEADPNERTWFISNKIYSKWLFQGYVDLTIIENWCLSDEFWWLLSGYITKGRRSHHHEQWAKSWPSRREAEAALIALNPLIALNLEVI